MSIAQRPTSGKGVPSGRSRPPESPPQARDEAPKRAPAGTEVPQLPFPPGGISLLLPESIEARIANALSAHKLEWLPPIRLEYGKDPAQIRLIRSGQNHLVVMYFDASQLVAKWPTWYLSSLFIRVWRKLRNDKCNRPPSILLLVNDETLIGRWDFESQMWQQAGLITHCSYEILGDWDDSVVDEKVKEWATQLQDNRSQASVMQPSGNASALLASSVSPNPGQPNQYFVFMASPGDTTEERDEIREYFKRVNYQKLSQGVIFTVLDWEHFSSARKGDPQQNIFEDVLRTEYQPLVLVICVLRHRLGGDARRESGTKQEFEWACDQYQKNRGALEIKWFFSEQSFNINNALTEQQKQDAFAQYMSAQAFGQKIRSSNEFSYVSYQDKDDFRVRLQEDLGKWLEDKKRPWNSRIPEQRNIGWTTSG